MYKQADARAKAWKPDAKFTSMSNTTLGLLKPDGTAASWHLIFQSESAKSWVSINTANGYLTCSANAGAAGRIPDVKPDFSGDGAALFAIREAARRGAARAGLRRDDRDRRGARHASRDVEHQLPQGRREGRQSCSSIVDANTGKVEKVLK